MGLGAAGIGLLGAGTVLQGIGGYQQMQATKALHRYNAAAKEREAAQIRRASIQEQITRRTEARKLLATRQVGYAKAGVMMKGSPMEAQLDVASEMSEDIRRLTEQYGLAEQRAKSEAEIERYKARAAGRAGTIDIFTSVLGGGAQIGKYKMQSRLLSEGLTA